MNSDEARTTANARKKFGAGPGRPKVPSGCPKCGTVCDSAREALVHCMGKKRRRK